MLLLPKKELIKVLLLKLWNKLWLLHTRKKVELLDVKLILIVEKLNYFLLGL